MLPNRHGSEVRYVSGSRKYPNLKQYCGSCMSVRSCYMTRARGCSLETHPSGLQVNLQTGVGHGVLVARDTDQCARLLRGVLLKELEFELEEEPDQGDDFLKGERHAIDLPGCYARSAPNQLILELLPEM